jgi:hypothetical protein
MTSPPGGEQSSQPEPSGWSSQPDSGQWQQAPQWQQPPYGQAPETNGRATAAMVTGILSLLICAPAGIAAVIVGNGAKNQIDQSGGLQGGRGMAVAGVVMGWIAIAVMIIGIIFSVLFFAGLAASGGAGAGTGI